MCLTSGESRNNAEFQTGFLGTSSPDQSNHQAIVQFHQFGPTRRLWDRKLCRKLPKLDELYFAAPHAQGDRVTPEEIQGANWGWGGWSEI